MKLSKERRTFIRRLHVPDDEGLCRDRGHNGVIAWPCQRVLLLDDAEAAENTLTAIRSLVENATDPRVALADIAALLKASDR